MAKCLGVTQRGYGRFQNDDGSCFLTDATGTLVWGTTTLTRDELLPLVYEFEDKKRRELDKAKNNLQISARLWGEVLMELLAKNGLSLGRLYTAMGINTPLLSGIMHLKDGVYFHHGEPLVAYDLGKLTIHVYLDDTSWLYWWAEEVDNG